ncbi:MAG: hydantoinase/oxoprolinase family protein, partial [Firmicutes bacterium]|nr:hydantoinase/oxoprolinase family protein [Bacillota bacterium]
LDREAAICSVASIAPILGMTVTETAEGICAIADAKMADAIRQLTVRKGIDPREFVLVAFGGAGPMQACSTAEELEIENVLVPDMPGIFSAWGMLQSDIRQDLARTMQCNLDKADLTQISDRFIEMTAEAMSLLEKQHITQDKAEFIRSVDMRYLGQEYTVRVNFMSNEITKDSILTIKKAFHDQHYQIYGHCNPEGEVEIVNLRLVGLGRIDKIPKQESIERSTDTPRPLKSQTAVFNGKEYEAKVYERKNLIFGQCLDGPAIILELTATTVTPPGWRLTVDGYRNLLISKKPGGNKKC